MLLVALAPTATVAFAPATGRRWATAAPSTARHQTSLFAESATLETPPVKKSDLVSGKCVVTGFLEDSAVADQFVFDLLHKHEVFDSIVAVCPDPDSAKKRLMSRSARYTGLLDVLDFATSDAAVPDLEGVNAWLAFGADTSAVEAQAEAAKGAGVKHLVVVAAAEGAVDFKGAAAVLEGSDTAFTFLQTGALGAGKEGGGIVMTEGTDAAVPAGAILTKEDAVRVACEAFVLPPAKNKAFALYAGPDEYALKYLKSVRGQGYDRAQEIGFLMTGGYQDFVDEEKKKEAEEAEKEAGKNKEMTAEEKAAYDAKRKKDANDFVQELAEEKKKKYEEQVLTVAERECDRAWLKQRYAKQQEEGVSSDYGIVSRDTYFENNLDLFIAHVRENGELNSLGNLVLLTDEDRERNAAVARSLARKEALEEQKKAKELEKQLDKQVEELKWEHEGKFYVKVETEGKTIILDEEGVDIVGQWNEETQAIEPYVDDLGILEEIEAELAEDAELLSEARKLVEAEAAAAASAPATEEAEKEE